ncbi:thiaminase II [Chengkuizengella axinellae]|uniref:Aminopyrimidine aminohydrolase n=1 Tax=Chengkuizengella axinellae TaxID=3064388 RepID=A0ABT9J032_9BACL|nr:thiaminase II [Chengkuizengella sp. 2205SS18-9]MDP5274986.1 thiaminase II [Chengkuizengella sp. 2205SS18-9]
MKFTEQIRKEVDPIWEASFNHPFVAGLADGTLSMDRFRFYVLQDSYYLSHFARIQSIAAAQADDLHTISRMASHAVETNRAELSLHKHFFVQLDISEEDIASFKPAPSAYAYVSHLYRAAHTGQIGDTVAAILPCYWLYYEIGEKQKHAIPDEPIYQEWIATYGGDWFGKLVNEVIQLTDDVAEKVSEADRERMKENYLISSQYEYMFWEMAYRKETWPVDLSSLPTIY